MNCDHSRETISEINMKFYFFVLCSVVNVEGGVWFGPKDGLGGDDGEIINFMRPRKMFAVYTNANHIKLVIFYSFIGQNLDNCDHVEAIFGIKER